MSLSKLTFDHIIVWLDQIIASPDCCQQLKKAFATTTNPESETSTSIDELDITNLIHDDSKLKDTSFLQIPFNFKLFSDVELCLKFLLDYAGQMRIFFITSGSLGENIVPRILTDHQQIFKDKNGNISEDSIYIFCANTKYHSEWAYDYIDLNCIKMENDDRAILARLTRDIAKYFVEEGQRFPKNEDILSLNYAKQYFEWARELYFKADSVKKMPSTSDLIQNIDQLIEQIEPHIKQFYTRNNNNDETNLSEEN